MCSIRNTLDCFEVKWDEIEINDREFDNYTADTLTTYKIMQTIISHSNGTIHSFIQILCLFFLHNARQMHCHGIFFPQLPPIRLSRDYSCRTIWQQTSKSIEHCSISIAMKPKFWSNSPFFEHWTWTVCVFFFLKFPFIQRITHWKHFQFSSFFLFTVFVSSLRMPILYYVCFVN